MELESDIEGYLKWKVAMLHGKSYKVESPYMRGLVDQLVCLPDGTTHLIEVKRPKGGRLSPQQKEFAADMVRLKQRYAVLATREAIDAYFA